MEARSQLRHRPTLDRPDGMGSREVLNYRFIIFAHILFLVNDRGSESEPAGYFVSFHSPLLP